MMPALLLAAALPGLLWRGDPESLANLKTEVKDVRIILPADSAALQAYTKVPAPKTQMRMNQAAATSVPWVDANGWRFNRGLKQAFYSELPKGAASLAAAEAHAYGVDAVLALEPEDLPALTRMLAFLKSADAPRLPVLANIGVVDDGTPTLGEVLNLLGRRNLLYRVVPGEQQGLDLIIRLGTNDFPKETAANPNDFAARVREKLTDEKRLLRVYGSYTVIGHLTGDSSRARLYLLNYGRNPAKDVHIRVLRPYKRVQIKDSADPQMKAADVSFHQGAAEFTIPTLQTYTIVDLEK